MDGSTDIPLCDSEPIHVPGSIQPHGVMLVAARHGLLVWQAAGDVEGWLAAHDWLGTPLAALLGQSLTDRIAAIAERTDLAAAAEVFYVGQVRSATGMQLDVSAYLAGLAGAPAQDRDMVVVELEPATEAGVSASTLLDELEAATSSFQRAGGLETLCQAAAAAFRRLIGFDRVMIYRFLDDDAGRVLGESRRDDLRSFMHHHFPASDIPRQARALYARNLVRVIPDIHYTPLPLRPPAPGAPLDMSDSSLRSVSPIHLQYLFNMGVRGSASFSIMKDGGLWGLVACHNESPRRIAFENRVACRSLAATLSREIKAKEEADGYRQRLRLRGFEDDVVRLLSRDASLDHALSNHVGEVQRAMSADGVAVLRGHELLTGGVCPPPPAIRALAAWILAADGDAVRATDRLGELYEPAARFADCGSGLLALVLSASDPWLVLWFRAEQVETLNWAGNPHKSVDLNIGEQLTPRASFDDWKETVRGRARRWTAPELESAARLRNSLLDVQQNRRLLELNRQLTDILKDKDRLLQRTEFLMSEVNHRVQNSLQLVGSFLALQSRSSDSEAVQAALDEAQRRLAAVALVHRRLYRGDQIETIDAARYMEELCADTLVAMGAEWRAHLSTNLAPVIISTDRAVTLGLVLTELMINVNKYAYGGAAGPLEVTLAEEPAGFRLIVADHGVGRGAAQDKSGHQGFGSRLIKALVGQLGGELDYQDNRPGLRAVLSVHEAGRPPG